MPGMPPPKSTADVAAEDFSGAKLFLICGEALLVYANRILSANEAALAHMRRPEAEGLIRFGAPDDYASYLLAPILADQADVVFGSRFMGGHPHRVLYFWHSVGNGFLTLLSNMFTNLNLTDMETCYKVFRRDIIQGITIEEKRFGFEPEITAKVARTGCRIYEVGISYHGRTYAEGKKIGWRDGVRAIWCILKYNLRR